MLDGHTMILRPFAMTTNLVFIISNNNNNLIDNEANKLKQHAKMTHESDGSSG